MKVKQDVLCIRQGTVYLEYGTRWNQESIAVWCRLYQTIPPLLKEVKRNVAVRQTRRKDDTRSGRKLKEFATKMTGLIAMPNRWSEMCSCRVAK